MSRDCFIVNYVQEFLDYWYSEMCYTHRGLLPLLTEIAQLNSTLCQRVVLFIYIYIHIARVMFYLPLIEAALTVCVLCCQQCSLFFRWDYSSFFLLSPFGPQLCWHNIIYNTENCTDWLLTKHCTVCCCLLHWGPVFVPAWRCALNRNSIV